MSDKPGRLPSLRGPRDLTLGGVKKKTFAPKIPVRKDRSKREQTAKEVQTERKEVSKRGRPSRGRGRGRGRPEIIQSHSIFEAGPTVNPGKRSGERGFSTSSGGSAKETIQKPTLTHEIVDEDFENSKTEEALRNLEGGSSFIEDLENDGDLLPTCLPMTLSSWPPPSTTRCERTVSCDGSDSAEIFKDCTLKQDSDSPKIIVFQLPDSLPALPTSGDAEVKHEVKVESGTKVKQENQIEQELEKARCSLDQLSEGYVGKLQVMKSGRSRLIMGGIVLDLNAGTPPSFLEELAAIEVSLSDPSCESGVISVLGNVAHKVICSPDMESLIQQCSVAQVT